MVFLRNNILTYLKEESKRNVFEAVMEALRDNGWLIIGSHEKLPGQNLPFIRHPSIPWAFQKKISYKS